MSPRMRLLTILLFALAGCGSGASGDDAGMPADCPTGFESPAYCFSGAGGTANTCGDCSTAGEICHYFEADLICESGKWRCYWAGGDSKGCPHPDGGP